MGNVIEGPTVIYIDNTSAIQLAKDLHSCQRSRHIERRFLKLREWVAAGEIKLEYIDTKENPADALTKHLDADTLARHVAKLMGDSKSPMQASNSSIRQRCGDVQAAYLQGQFDHNAPPIYARPPPGARAYVKGVPVVWRLKAPLYGEADAGRVWFNTLVSFLHKHGWTQSEYDPCYHRKILSDDTRIDMVVYVDDAYIVDDGSPLADKELQLINDKFTFTVVPARFFLGNSIDVLAP